MKNSQINKLLLEAHDRSVELAIDTSIRTGVPLVVEKNGKIIEIQPKYEYVRIPLKKPKKKKGK